MCCSWMEKNSMNISWNIFRCLFFFKKVIRVYMKAYFRHKIKNKNKKRLRFLILQFWLFFHTESIYIYISQLGLFSIFWEIKSQSSCLYFFLCRKKILHRFGLRWGKWWPDFNFWVNYCFNFLVFLLVVHQHKFYSMSSLFNVCLLEWFTSDRTPPGFCFIYLSNTMNIFQWRYHWWASSDARLTMPWKGIWFWP